MTAPEALFRTLLFRPTKCCLELLLLALPPDVFGLRSFFEGFALFFDGPE